MKKLLLILGIGLLTLTSCDRCNHQYVLDGRSAGLWEEYHCIKCADSYRLWLDDWTLTKWNNGVPTFKDVKKGDKTKVGGEL